jgi:hypothetical protein
MKVITEKIYPTYGYEKCNLKTDGQSDIFAANNFISPINQCTEQQSIDFIFPYYKLKQNDLTFNEIFVTLNC